MKKITESDDNKSIAVVIDAFRDDSLKAIRGFLEKFCLKSGDTLTVLVVLQQVNNPSTFSIMGVLKMMGYWVSVDSGSMLGTNEKIVEGARKDKEVEYNTKKEIIAISKQCEVEKIGFNMMVLSRKTEALEEARLSRATWVILDKEMKRDKKMFIDGLSCGIARMKNRNAIEILRPPKDIGDTAKPLMNEVNTKLQNDNATTTTQSNTFYYDEMIPGSPKGKHSHHKSSGDGKEESPYNTIRKRGSIPASSSSEHLSKSSASSSFKERTPTDKSDLEWDKAEEKFSSRKRIVTPDQEYDLMEEWFETNDELVSICSKCGNRRPKIESKKDFTYAELHAATKGFSDTKFLSEGGFGSVYKGELRNGLKIAVKQHKHASQQGEREFMAEVHFLSMARHENLVMLLGSCSEGNHRLLVYEYVCNGSLDQHLSKHARKPLSWNERMKIATGAAKGLQYLHKKNIVHRDIRPNNILLTHDYDPLLGDFGLARTQKEDHSSETRVVGTLGYLAPEYAESGKVSTKTDVYAFGVILLQLITGRGTNDKSLNGKSLVGWARPLLQDKNYPNLIDPRIMDSHDFHQLFWMVRVAEKCLAKDPYKRMTMDTIVYALKHVRESDAICNIKLSPAHSNSSPCSPLDTPEENGDDDDRESYAIEPKLVCDKFDYGGFSGGISHSSSSESISSGSSSMSSV